MRMTHMISVTPSHETESQTWTRTRSTGRFACPDTRMDCDDHKLDYLVPLEAGGHPRKLSNLRLQPWRVSTARRRRMRWKSGSTHSCATARSTSPALRFASRKTGKRPRRGTRGSDGNVAAGRSGRRCTWHKSPEALPRGEASGLPSSVRIDRYCESPSPFGCRSGAIVCVPGSRAWPMNGRLKAASTVFSSE